METKITATQLARSLSDVLNRVRYRGERFIVERNGEPMASVGPALPWRAITGEELAALLAELPWPDKEFFDELEVIQASQPPIGPDPWAN